MRAVELDLGMLATLAELSGWRRGEIAANLLSMSGRLLVGDPVEALSAGGEEIAPPPEEGDYPRRNEDCQQALGPGFLEIVENAVRAGWGRDEIALALVLASNRLMPGQTSRAWPTG
ncbi:MAG: hypothetical protein Kow0026_02610 [Oricola sp.]